MTEATSIPFISDTGLINLGPANNSAVKRLANYAQAIIKSGQPIPNSPFIEWAAERVTGADRQDLVFFLQGRRGSGKSYSCLYLGQRFAEAIARRVGGSWGDYFSLRNCATLEDNEKVLELLNSAGKYQVVLIDDCSLAISNRSWNSPQNRNFNALLSVCRTNRWILLLTAPLRSHVDNQVREMCDITGYVFKSFHRGGFNIIKMNSSEISVKNKEYFRRMSFFKRKVDFWVAFRPDPELTKNYDIQRDESARKVNSRIVETGSFRATPERKAPTKTLAERNADEFIQTHGESVRKRLAETPSISVNKLSANFGISYQKMERVLSRMGIPEKPAQ